MLTDNTDSVNESVTLDTRVIFRLLDVAVYGHEHGNTMHMIDRERLYSVLEQLNLREESISIDSQEVGRLLAQAISGFRLGKEMNEFDLIWCHYVNNTVYDPDGNTAESIRKLIKLTWDIQSVYEKEKTIV